MTRYDILFGQNFTDLSFAGLNGAVIEPLRCDVSLGGKLLDTMLIEHDGDSYMLYDVQDLIPMGDAIAMPVFQNGFAVYDGFVQQLDLKYYTDTRNETVSRKILPGARVSGFDWTGGFGRFLTKQPRVQKTSFRATEWLWFLMNFVENANAVVLKIAITGKSGNVTEKAIPIAGYLTDKLLCVDCSAEFVAANFEIEKQYIDSYKIWLENDEIRISEVREYYIVNSSAYDVELLVLNSFGVWDMLNVIAGQKNSKEFELQYSENRRKTKLEAATWIDKYALTITDLEQGWLEYLIEIIISRKTYLRDGSELRAIVCTSKNYDDYYNTKVQDEATIEFRGEGVERSVKV